MENKEQQKLYTHYLECIKCHLRFSIENDSPDNKKLKLQEMKCPVCSASIQLDPSKFYDQGKMSKEKQSHLNAELSKEAMKMAIEQKRMDKETGENKMVSVKSTQEGKNFGKTDLIPEKAIKSIEEKVKENPALMEE